MHLFFIYKESALESVTKKTFTNSEYQYIET